MIDLTNENIKHIIYVYKNKKFVVHSVKCYYCKSLWTKNHIDKCKVINRLLEKQKTTETRGRKSRYESVHITKSP